MAVPYTFGSATSSIPLSQLDSNFSTPITLGNTSIQLGNTVTTLNNMTLANVTVSSVASTFPNNYLANSTATLGNSTITLGGTTSSVGNLTLVNATISSGTYSVTDATVSGNLTLSGGTANGVAYLNGSKVLTTGSALTFDGTSLQAAAARGTYALKIYNSSDGSVAGNFGALTGNVFAIDATGPANTMTFLTGGSEQMRLTSTGLGIGTSSPGSKLDVKGKLTLSGVGTSELYTADSSGLFVTALGAGMKLAADGNFVFGKTSSPYTTFATLDTSGNLGLGVTPSAWTSSSKAIELPYGCSVYQYGTYPSVYFAANTYQSGASTFTYKTSNPAAQYLISGNEHRWFTAASGTAGQQITFTQAMTLDASGRLGVGTTSPFGVLHATDGTSRIIIGTGGGSSGYNIYSSGGYQAFETNGQERARIDSSGNLLVGTTTANDKLTVANSGSAASIGAGNGTNYTRLGYANSNGDYQNNSTAGDAVLVGNNGVCVVGGTGGATSGVRLANGSTSWASLSDERIKNIIEPISNASQKVCSLRAVIGRYKTDEEEKRRSFLIAQDVQAVLPEAVVVQDDEIGTLGLQYTDTIPLLVAAIQEQQTIINQLKSRLDAANL